MKSRDPNSKSTDRPASSSRRAPIEKKVRIKVVGVGGAGVNALDQFVSDGFDGVSLHAINTDAQALANCMVGEKLQIGEKTTHGLGAGGDPEVGRAAAEEDSQALRDLVEGYDMIFLAAGLGGGTGTGAGPKIARLAREEGCLVLALVTLPFGYEGQQRREVALEGLREMQEAADAVICIPNDKLLHLAGEATSVLEAFVPTDKFLSSGVQRIWQMLTRNGLINIDFADLRTVLRRRDGETLIGFGDGNGPDKVRQALDGAFGGPLLSDRKMLAKAESVLVGINHGPDLRMSELTDLMKELNHHINPGAICKHGVLVDEKYSDQITLLVIASTGKVITEGATTTSGSGEKKMSPVVEGGSLFKELGVPSLPEKTSVLPEEAPLVTRQVTLNLDEAGRGLFEKVERTMVDGEDLDRPTFIRRGIRLRNL